VVGCGGVGGEMIEYYLFGCVVFFCYFSVFYLSCYMAGYPGARAPRLAPGDPGWQPGTCWWREVGGWVGLDLLYFFLIFVCFS